MPDAKITALASIGTGSDPANDPLVIVDVSDTSMAATGTTKKVTLNNLLACSPTATLASATITGDLTVRTNKLAVTNTGVGVGTASPNSPFHVDGICYVNSALTLPALSTSLVSGEIHAGAGNAASSDSGFLRLSAGGGTTLGVKTALDIYRESGSGAAGLIAYIGGSTAMTLNATGLGVGVTPSAIANVIRLEIGGALSTNLTLRSSSGNASARNWMVGSNVNAFGDFVIRQGNSQGAEPNSGTDRLVLDASGRLLVGLTSANASGGILQLSSGITFPATQVASSDVNTLDDYEEGTWSPTIISASGTPTTVTVNSATYTKIGRLVVCCFDFSIVNIGTASSSLQFSLPFTAATSASFCGAFREKATTGSMGQVFYNSATDASCLLYNNNTVWVNGYRISGNYTYFAA